MKEQNGIELPSEGTANMGVDIGQIFNDCENAIVEALTMLYKNRPDYLILFLSQGEYNPLCEKIEGVSSYCTDYTMNFHENHYQRDYIIHYLNRNYKRPGYTYTEETIDDLITEMMIYSIIWEDVGYLKFLLRLAQLVDEKDYIWDTGLEYHNYLHTVITEQIISPLKNQRLALGDLIQSAYSSDIRNAFAHSMYTIYPDSRKIELWLGRDEKGRRREWMTFDEFQEKFLLTIRIWNYLFHMVEECRKSVATDKVKTGLIPLPDGKVMEIWAEMMTRGDKLMPSFRGKVYRINDAKQ